MNNKLSRNICILLLVALVTVLTLTGCKEDKTKGQTEGFIEGIYFKETNNITNFVKIETNKDEIILIELIDKYAPNTVKNFQELVSSKFYDGLTFHRTIENFVIQTGDPTATGTGGSDNTIKGEFLANGVNNELSHTKGVISMARNNFDYDSASSQFFICVDDVTFLDDNYASFGKVIAGMDTVERISKVKTDSNDKPLANEKIKTIRFVNLN